MLDKLRMRLFGNAARRIASGRAVCRNVLHYHRTCANRSPAAYFYLLDDSGIGADVNVVAYDGRSFGMGTDGGKLKHIYIIAYDGLLVDHDAAAMVNVKAIADACACLYKESVFLHGMHAPTGNGEEPPFVLAQAHIDAETHARARDAAQPYRQESRPPSAVTEIVAFDELNAVAVVLRYGNVDFLITDIVGFLLHISSYSY